MPAARRWRRSLPGRDDKNLSRFLSLVLRHKPETIGLALDPQGWAEVAEIVARADFAVTAADIARVVAESDKQRFALSPDGSRIRANQGHSLDVNLGLSPVAPPPSLWHGTGEAAIAAIRTEGLVKGQRRHVHLSGDPETAHKVGQRHGRPVVLGVDSAAMAAEGLHFFLSANGVWLTEAVPPRFLTFPRGA